MTSIDVSEFKSSSCLNLHFTQASTGVGAGGAESLDSYTFVYDQAQSNLARSISILALCAILGILFFLYSIVF
jgi:hypothetical protein